jgi:hypothetical protein
LGVFVSLEFVLRMALRVARMALALASLPLGVVAQLADMDVAFDDGLDFLNGGPYGGLNAVTMSPYEMYKWPWGTIPQRCYTGASEDDLCSPYDMEVYDVWFPDVSDTRVELKPRFS